MAAAKASALSMGDRTYFTIIGGLFAAWTLTGLYNNGWQIGVFGPGLILGFVFLAVMTFARIYVRPNTDAADTFGAPPEDWKTRVRARLYPVVRHWRWLVGAAIAGLGLWFLYLLDWNLPLAIGIVVLLALLIIPQMIGDYLGSKIEDQARKTRTGRTLLTGFWLIIFIIMIIGLVIVGIDAWQDYQAYR